MIGIIGAMEIETNALIEKLENKEEVIYKQYKMTKGTLAGKEVVVCKCGIGKVNSSTAAMLMSVRFGVDTIINIGVAGGYKTLKQGDLVISEKTVQHDYDQTPDGLKKGQIQGFDSEFLPCDKDLVEKVYSIAKSKNYSVVKGTVATGDQFIASNVVSSKITSDFGAVAYDMESGALNHVCTLLGIKFVAIRAISDNGTDDAVESFYTFVEKAAMRSIDTVCEYIKSV